MDSEEYRKNIEKKILQLIEEKLITGQMDASRAQAIARMVLDKLHPHMTIEEIYRIVPTLDDHFSELCEVVQSIVYLHDEKIKQAIAIFAENLMHQGKIAEAY